MASGRPALPVLPQFLQISTRRPFPARGQAGPCTRSARSQGPRQTPFPGPLGHLCPQRASFRRPRHGPGALPRPALTQERSVNASCRSSCTPVLQRLPPPPASVSPSVRGVERTAPGPPLPVSNAPRSKFEFHRFPPRLSSSVRTDQEGAASSSALIFFAVLPAWPPAASSVHPSLPSDLTAARIRSPGAGFRSSLRPAYSSRCFCRFFFFFFWILFLFSDSVLYPC